MSVFMPGMNRSVRKGRRRRSSRSVEMPSIDPESPNRAYDIHEHSAVASVACSAPRWRRTVSPGITAQLRAWLRQVPRPKIGGSAARALGVTESSSSTLRRIQRDISATLLRGSALPAPPRQVSHPWSAASPCAASTKRRHRRAASASDFGGRGRQV